MWEGEAREGEVAKEKLERMTDRHTDNDETNPEETYHFFPWEDPLAQRQGLLVLIHFIIFLVHPLVKGICVHDPLSMHLRASHRVY